MTTLLKYLNRNICFVVFFCSFLVSSCNTSSSDDNYLLLQKDLKENYHINIPKNATCLIFISDEGCPNCVISFSQLILQNIDNYKNTGLVIIHSAGKNVDIDSYSSIKNKNIKIYSDYPDKSEIIPSLGIVYLKPQKQEVDTIIYIDAFIIKEQFQYILQRN